MHVPSNVTKLASQTCFGKVGQKESFAGFQVKRSVHLMALDCSSISTFSMNVPQAARKNCTCFSYFVFVDDISVSCSSRMCRLWRCRIQGRLRIGTELPEGPARVRQGSADVLMSTRITGPSRAVTSLLPIKIFYSGAAKGSGDRKYGCSSQYYLPNPKLSSAGKGHSGCSQRLWPLPVLSLACPTFIQEHELSPTNVQICLSVATTKTAVGTSRLWWEEKNNNKNLTILNF